MDSDSILKCVETDSLESPYYKKKIPVKDNYEKKVDNYIESISTDFNTTNKTKKWPLCSVTFQQISLKNVPSVKIQFIHCLPAQLLDLDRVEMEHSLYA